MARMAEAEWVGEYGVAGAGALTPDILCFHTIVGYAPAHAAHMSTRRDGHIFQSRDTKYRSAANYNGNYRVVAVETEDHGAPEFPAWDTRDGHAVPAWTPAQCEAHARIVAWAHVTHGIPIALIPDTLKGRRGVAFHRQGIPSDNNFAGFQYGGVVPGGEIWTTSKGKVCPGDRRIAQLITVVIPLARQLVGLGPGAAIPPVVLTSSEEENEMYYARGDVKIPNVGSPVYAIFLTEEGLVRRWVTAEEGALLAKVRPGGFDPPIVPQAMLNAVPKKIGSKDWGGDTVVDPMA